METGIIWVTTFSPKEEIIMKIGFIGCGNMATAMLKGILKSGEVAATDMIASAK